MKNEINTKDLSTFIEKSVFKLKKEKILSSCIDGRYNKKEAIIAPRALPGADLGFLILALGVLNEIQKTGRNFSFKFKQKVLEEILNLVGGAKNFMFHTDNHNLSDICSGCGHFSQVKNNPKIYGLENKDLNLILNFLKHIKKKGSKEIILKGKHNESIVLIVENNNFGVIRKIGDIQAFVFHKFLYEDFLNKLVLKLINWPEFSFLSLKKLKSLFLKIGKRQFSETLRRVAYNLPVFKIKEKNKKLILIKIDSSKFI